MPANLTSVFPLALANSFHTLPYLSLGMITASLRVYEQGGLNDRFTLEPLHIGGVEGYCIEAIYQKIGRDKPAICLMSSYVWNHELNLQSAKALKDYNSQALIIVGGPEIPKYPGQTEEFLQLHPYIDIAVLGEGEIACAEILSAIPSNLSISEGSLEQVQGIVFSDGEKMVRTGERNRLMDIDLLPSPYLTGEFEPWFTGFESTILETNRGCPYGCTYCDWGSATLERVAKFNPDRVTAEINYIADRKGESIFIADANFGMLEQDIAIASALVSARARTGYPKRLYTNFAKNGGRRLMSTIKILNEGGLLPTGIIALQTTDDHVLRTIKRDNIKTSAYEKMMVYFNAEKIPMATDLMIGLPGQTTDSLERDLQFCFNWKVSANGNYTSMMPNAPMAEPHYMSENMIVADTNNMVISTSTFTADDLAYMKTLYSTYMFHVKLATLKYYLYFLQLDHGVPALKLLRLWLDRILEGDTNLPISTRVYREIFRMESRTRDWAVVTWGDKAQFLFNHIEDFFEEIYLFTAREFGVSLSDSERRSIFKVQAAVIPHINRPYPYTVSLEHDVEAYFAQLEDEASINAPNVSILPLIAFKDSTFTVGKEAFELQSIKMDKILGHSDEGWELDSAIRFY